jgi:hypothetical protein
MARKGLIRNNLGDELAFHLREVFSHTPWQSGRDAAPLVLASSLQAEAVPRPIFALHAIYQIKADAQREI